MSDHYILLNQEVIKEPDLMTWARWFETADRIVRKTQITPDVRVSTVFLGLDHQWEDGPPLLFETMVFGGDNDGDQWHYSTYAQAVGGHAMVVKKLSKEETQ